MQNIETRWPTRNTKLAASMLVLGFELRQADPFTVTLNEEGTGKGLVVTFWFAPSKPDGMLAADVSNAWDARSWEPLETMRLVLEKRDWLIRDVIQGNPPKMRPPEPHFKTDNLHVAAICAAQNVFLYRYNDHYFYFAEKGLEIDRESRMSDGELARLKKQRGVTNWQKKVLAQQDMLMALVKNATRERAINTLTNIRGDAAFIPHNTPREVRRSILQQFVITGQRPENR
jgi:hypothetical protein